MVSSTGRKIISLAISLLVVVISLTGVALGATAPTVTALSRYTPGFAGAPGKMARDAAGNFYVTDFWGRGIVKLDRQGSKIGFIATLGRPSAVAVLPDNRLVVAMTAPQAYVAFYSQLGSSPNVTGEEIAQLGSPAKAYFRPTGITVDAAGYIYTVDSGDSFTSTTVNVGTVRVYSSAGAYLYAFGTRTQPGEFLSGDAFKQPMGIAYEKASNQVVVVDTMNSMVKFFSAWNGSACTYQASIGSHMWEYPELNLPAKLGDPTDVAFEYSGASLSRMYITERTRNEISVVDVTTGSPTYGYDLKRINGTTVTTADMKHPSGVVFEKTTTGGVLYASNASTSTPANILALAIDSGTIPSAGATLTINAVPSTSLTTPIAISGTNSGAFAVSCSVNGGADVPATGTTSWTISSLGLVSGTNSILCKTSNGTVNSFAGAATFYDPAPVAGPTPTILLPLTGSYTNNVSQTVSGTTSAANATVKVDGSLGGTCSTTSDAKKDWSCTLTLPEGVNVLTASASKAGTTVVTANVTVTVDVTPPNMTGTISFLTNAATTTTAVQNLDGIVLDVNLGSVEVSGVEVPASARVTLTGNNTYFSAPVTLVRGPNTVTVKATDLAGNTTTLSRTATLNPEIPGLTVALPADNSYRAAGAANASGTADTAFTAVDACGTPLTPAGGNWSTAAMTVAGGFNSCQFIASGGSTTVSEKRTINANAGYAQLAITSPAADLATNSSPVIISGSVAPSSPVPQISIDGAAAVDVTTYTSADGLFSHSVTLASQGLHTVKLIANAATTAVRNIIYDTTLPEITIKADSKISPTKISGLIDPSAKISAVSAALGTGTPFTIPVSVLTFDSYNPASGSVVWHADLNGYTYDKITFTTADPAGNLKDLMREAGVPTGDVDADGVVRLSDALAALRHVAGTESLLGTPKFQADVGALVEGHAGQDGIIDIHDAVLILGKSYGLISF